LQELENSIKDLQHIELSEVPSGSRQQQLRDYEFERNKLLLADEALWRQRCRVRWIKCGDLNIKYFHRFSSNSRNNKHIWEISDDSGTSYNGQQNIEDATTRFFKTTYWAIPPSNLQEQVDVAQLFPHSVTLEDSTLLDRPCSLNKFRMH
jgi:hypothetical protein